MHYYKTDQQMKRAFNWDTILSLIPALVLTLVASFHIWRSLHEPLSSWRGGGFGMYANILDERGRKFSVKTFNTHWRVAELPPNFRSRFKSTLLNPTHQKIKKLAEYLSCDADFKAMNPNFTTLRIEYLEMRFEKAESKVFMELIDEATVNDCEAD